MPIEMMTSALGANGATIWKRANGIDNPRLVSTRLLVRLVGVKINDIVSGHYQINLFHDTEEMLSLYNTMDYIRGRYGEASIMRASSMGANSIGRFDNPSNDEPPTVLATRNQ